MNLCKYQAKMVITYLDYAFESSFMIRSLITVKNGLIMAKQKSLNVEYWLSTLQNIVKEGEQIKSSNDHLFSNDVINYGVK